MTSDNSSIHTPSDGGLYANSQQDNHSDDDEDLFSQDLFEREKQLIQSSGILEAADLQKDFQKFEDELNKRTDVILAQLILEKTENLNK